MFRQALRSIAVTLSLLATPTLAQTLAEADVAAARALVAPHAALTAGPAPDFVHSLISGSYVSRNAGGTTVGAAFFSSRADLAGGEGGLIILRNELRHSGLNQRITAQDAPGRMEVATTGSAVNILGGMAQLVSVGSASGPGLPPPVVSRTCITGFDGVEGGLFPLAEGKRILLKYRTETTAPGTPSTQEQIEESFTVAGRTEALERSGLKIEGGIWRIEQLRKSGGIETRQSFHYLDRYRWIVGADATVRADFPGVPPTVSVTEGSASLILQGDAGEALKTEFERYSRDFARFHADAAKEFLAPWEGEIAAAPPMIAIAAAPTPPPLPAPSAALALAAKPDECKRSVGESVGATLLSHGLKHLADHSGSLFVRIGAKIAAEAVKRC
ncbi:MAG: hypothetical protein FJX47_08880 [Alphaproteobacteria bacterium]|nr:hypothetical protein [Alphaproteobacteria bacterium]